MNQPLNFESFFIQKNYLIQIPSYQRAYAWEEKQIQEFVQDLVDIQGKDYYYGHFIVELDDQNQKLEIIDGQQRITTFVLFLLALKLYQNVDISKFEDFILNKFHTIDYDQNRFEELTKNILFHHLLVPAVEGDTSSFKRILDVFKYFEKTFRQHLKEQNIESILNSLLKAEISVHQTKDKKVAVQIFELQNSRGIKLDLIEKVKSLLMKEVYLNSSLEVAEQNIQIIQNHFAQIYQLEEKTSENSFRGDLTLDNLLFHHLRIIDDGAFDKTQEELEQPSTWGKLDENILNYLKEQISKSNPKVEYITKVSALFLKSVQYICETLIALDQQNRLIGDCIILDRSNSTELFLLLLHQNRFDELNLKLWEELLFLRDFHFRYYNLKGKRDHFALLFDRIIKKDVPVDENNSTNAIVLDFLTHGFRGYGNYLLKVAVAEDIAKSELLSNSFYSAWKEKVSYLLYKYEIENANDAEKSSITTELRNVFKKQKSIDHILPQSWQMEWVKDINNTEAFKESIQKTINGLGNLILITNNENASLSDKHPADKEYAINYGSYQKHNLNKHQWSDAKNWEKLIEERGNDLYRFLFDYFQLKN